MISTSNVLVRVAAPQLTGNVEYPKDLSAMGLTFTPEGVCINERKLSSTTELLALYDVLSMAGAGACAYHGWKRNKSYGWTILWSMFGGILPPVALLIAFIQGFGKPPKK